MAPKLMLTWCPSPAILLYVEAAEGYRAGGINTTGAPGRLVMIEDRSKVYKLRYDARGNIIAMQLEQPGYAPNVMIITYDGANGC